LGEVCNECELWGAGGTGTFVYRFTGKSLVSPTSPMYFVWWWKYFVWC